MGIIPNSSHFLTVAQAQPYFGEENRMGPEMVALIKASTIQFCKDVANGKDEAAWAHANQALAFQCGPKGTQALCDEMTADKKLGLAAIAGKLGCNEENRQDYWDACLYVYPC